MSLFVHHQHGEGDKDLGEEVQNHSLSEMLGVTSANHGDTLLGQVHGSVLVVSEEQGQEVSELFVVGGLSDTLLNKGLE